MRDKLPRGRYVVMVSMYNRLGGNVLRWSNLKGQQWSGATLPVPHGGRFYDVEIKVSLSRTWVLACANISKLIPCPGHGDMLRAWVYYEAKRSLNQKKCLSLVLFSLKTAF